MARFITGGRGSRKLERGGGGGGSAKERVL